MIRSEKKAGAFGIKQYRIPLLVILLGILLCIAAFVVLRERGRERIQTQFELEASDRYETIKKEIYVNSHVLLSAQVLYSGRHKVERSDFKDFAKQFSSHYHTIQALEWIPRIPNSQRETYERAARRDGFPGFQITDRGLPGKMVRSPQRQEYFPVYFVEPYKDNEQALGFDLASDQNRREAMERSRDTGEMVATGRIILVQETEGQFGFLIFAPIYRKGAPTDSVESRRQNLEGFVLGVFRIGNILKESLTYLNPKGLNIFLYDQSAQYVKDRYLGFYRSRLSKATTILKSYKEDESEAGLQYVKTLDVAGRKWQILFKPTLGLFLGKRNWQPWGVLFGGLLFTALLGSYLVTIINRTERIERVVRERTAKLRKTNEMLEHEVTVRTRAEEDLQKARDELEDRVKERTQELSATNEQLQIEITERKQAEEKVKQVSEEWKLTFNSIKDLVSIHGKDFRIVKVNKAFADTFGMENGELIGKKCYEIIHGTEEPWPNCPHRQTLECGKPVAEEFWEPRRGKYLEVSASPIRNEKGEMIGSVHITKDITERKQIEEVLRASEERYRSYIEVTGQLGWATNADGKVLEDIPAWRKFTGQAEEEVKGMGWSKALHPDDVEHTMQLWNKAVATKSAYEVEYRIRKYDGVYRHFLVRSVPVFKKDGSIHEWVGTCIDITDRKRIEEALKGSERRLADTIDFLPDATMVIDREGKVIAWNHAMEAMTGVKAKDMLGKGNYEYAIPFYGERRAILIDLVTQPQEEIKKRYAYIEKRPGGTLMGESYIPNLKGSEFYFFGAAAPLYDQKGDLVGAIECIRDITERKRAEEALRESEERSRSLIETSPDVIALMDFSGKIIVVNDAALTTYGYESKNELIGKSVLDFIIPEDRPRVLQEISKVLEVKTLRNLEYTSLKKDGSTFSIEVNASLILDAQQKPASIVIMIRDITERKRAGEEREKLIGSLQGALLKVKMLSGLLPICASCKKIRNDKGYWGQLESYISDHSEAEFTHGICPDCMKKLYPDLVD